ncbi:MAG: galactose mutarotase [Flavisolibacter sp.]|jgi:aldose 1-epimerase|nr:galactose mutarotase [Flavisolibacter sp.]
MLDPKNFERTINDKQTRLLVLKNDKGLEVTISNYGARIISLVFNDVNVIPSFPSLDAYASAIAPYHGATVGRYANRIAKGKFTLNGEDYSLAINNPPNHLHGGPVGFYRQVWDVENEFQNSLVLSYISEDGEEGYPGTVKVSVSYSLSAKNELVIEYTARTNAATPFNITNHAYFNLNGEGTILNHQLQINADSFTPVDKTLIPTGELKKVQGTAFDFTTSKRLGEHITTDEEQIKIGGGYDHNFVLNKEEEPLSFAAKAIGDKSGIVMEVFTEEPGIQLFSGNFEATKGDASTYRNTFCLETQHFPDSPNQPTFPNTILEVGEIFTSKTIYKFSGL